MWKTEVPFVSFCCVYNIIYIYTYIYIYIECVYIYIYLFIQYIYICFDRGHLARQWNTSICRRLVELIFTPNIAGGSECSQF